MNPRERNLAITVMSLLVLVGGFFAWTTVSEWFSTRQSQLTTLENRRTAQQQVIRLGSAATKQLKTMKERALPTDAEQARSLYSRWLLTLVDQSGFDQPSVRPLERRTRMAHYEQHGFQIEGQATLAEVVEFLIGFYQADELHRINMLTLTPVNNTRALDIIVNIDVLALPDTQRTQIGDRLVNDMPPEATQLIESTILERAVFFPPNKTPSLESPSEQRVVRGESLRLPLRGTDADPLDRLEYTLPDSPPSGMVIRSREDGTAELRWTPRESGEFKVRLQVSDDGTPRRSADTQLTIRVVDPPSDATTAGGPRSSGGFDHARQTFLVATLANTQGQEAWFDVRTRGEMLKLLVGGPIQVGTFTGTILRITDEAVEIQVGEQPMRIRIGESLTSATPITPPVLQADSRPPAANDNGS